MVGMRRLVTGIVGRRGALSVVTRLADVKVEALLAFESGTDDRFGTTNVTLYLRMSQHRLRDDLDFVRREVRARRLLCEETLLAQGHVSVANNTLEAAANDWKGIAAKTAMTMDGKATSNFGHFNRVEIVRCQVDGSQFFRHYA